MNLSKALSALMCMLAVSNCVDIPAPHEGYRELLLRNHNDPSFSSEHTKNEKSIKSYNTVDDLPKEHKVLLANSTLNEVHNFMYNKNPKNRIVKIIYRKTVKGSQNGNSTKNSKVTYDWIHSYNNVGDTIESGQSFYSTGNDKTLSSHHKQFGNTLVDSKVYKPHGLRNNLDSIDPVIPIDKFKKGYIKNNRLTEGNHNVKYIENFQSHDIDRVPDSSILLLDKYYLPKHQNLKKKRINYYVKKVSHSQPSESKTIKVVERDDEDWIPKQHEELNENNISEELQDAESENNSKEIPSKNINGKVHVRESNNNKYNTSADHNVGINSEIASHEKVPSSYIINEQAVDSENFVHEVGTSNKKDFFKNHKSTIVYNALVNTIKNDEYATPTNNYLETMNTDVPLRNSVTDNIKTGKTKDMPQKHVNYTELSEILSDELSFKNEFNKPPFEVDNNMISEENNSNISDHEDAPYKKVSLEFVPKEAVWAEDIVGNNGSSDEIPAENAIANVDKEGVDSDISTQDLNNEKDRSREHDAFNVQPTKTFVINKEISSEVPLENVVHVYQIKPKLKHEKLVSKSSYTNWATPINIVYHTPGKMSVPGHESNVPLSQNASELAVFEKILNEIGNKAKKLLRSEPNAAVINRLKLILKELNMLYYLENRGHVEIKDKSLPITILNFINDKTLDNDDSNNNQDESNDYNDINFPEDNSVTAVPIIDHIDTNFIPDENKQENYDDEDYYFKLIKLIQDLKRLRPDDYDSTIQSQLEQVVEYLQQFIDNKFNMVVSPNTKTFQAMHSQMEVNPKSPKQKLKWVIRRPLSYLNGQLNIDIPQKPYNSNRHEEDFANEPSWRKLYDVLNNRDKILTDESINSLVQLLSDHDDNEEVKLDIDERTVRKVLKLFQGKGISMENLTKVIAYLYKNSNKNHANDCTSSTYKNILKKLLMFLNFASHLTPERRHKK